MSDRVKENKSKSENGLSLGLTNENEKNTRTNTKPLLREIYDNTHNHLRDDKTNFRASDNDPLFKLSKHESYWLRCLKLLLPHHYTSMDSNRIMLGFFIISALDLLGILQSKTSQSQRQAYINWIYQCQISTGGFCGYPVKVGDNNSASLNDKETCSSKHEHHINQLNKMGSEPEAAHIPSTFFALCILAILEDDLTRVHTSKCLKWLGKMQRDDGSFGEILGSNERILGDRDPRFAYTAIGIQWMLTGSEGLKNRENCHFNVDRLVEFLTSLQAYDGGIADQPFRESHGGFTYCAVSALSLLGRLPSLDQVESPDYLPSPTNSETNYQAQINDIEGLIRWLVHRQTDLFHDDDDGDDGDGDGDTNANPDPNSDNKQNTKSCAQHNAHSPMIHSTVCQYVNQLPCAGFNGRTNKVADTCYAFWTLGSLSCLKAIHLIDPNLARNFLLERTQHLIGGFGKVRNEPPDLYHSYLGLAALSILQEPGLKPLNAALCISEDAAKRVQRLHAQTKRQTIPKTSKSSTND